MTTENVVRNAGRGDADDAKSEKRVDMLTRFLLALWNVVEENRYTVVGGGAFEADATEVFSRMTAADGQIVDPRAVGAELYAALRFGLIYKGKPGFLRWRSQTMILLQLYVVSLNDPRMLASAIIRDSGTGRPNEVLDVVREILLQHMRDPELSEWCRVKRATYVTATGRSLADNELCDGEPPTGVRLLMCDGSEVLLQVTPAIDHLRLAYAEQRA